MIWSQLNVVVAQARDVASGPLLVGLTLLKSNGMYADMYVVIKISIFYISLGYRPRRTLKFALWDASKYGHVGSFEWVQVFQFDKLKCL